jgi:hypothetical protein
MYTGILRRTMKLLHFTDSHLSLQPAPNSQFHVQPFWRGESKTLFTRLGQVIQKTDAIVFTGDATHGGGRAEAALFFEHLSIAAADKPVFMVLGNHDVVNPAYADHFYHQAQQYKNIRFTDGTHPLGPIDVLIMQAGYVSADHKVTNGWDSKIFPVPGISDESLTQLGAALAVNPDRPVVALTHCPTHFLPPTAAGFAPFVAPGMEAYRHRVNGLLDAHPRVKCLLAGHIHFNSVHVAPNGRVHQSLASFGEYPCQVRVVDVTSSKIESHLLSLASETEFE